MRDLARHLRANPQLLLLIVICLVLGLGTFLAILISLASHGGGQVSGEPSGALRLAWLG